MNTDTLIEELSRDLRPVSSDTPRAVLRRGLAGGAVVAAIAVVFWPTLGARSDLEVAVLTGAFWSKLLYTASLAFLGFLALERLGRPDVRHDHWMRLVWPPVAVLGAIAFIAWAGAPESDAASFWLGSSWWQCPLYVAALSIPVLAGLMWAMSRLAPTRLRAAGAAAGLVAGGVAATVYGLHCTETSPGFVLVWYSLGLALATLMGGVAGPRLMRW